MLDVYRDTTCGGTAFATLPTASLTTNRAGGANGSATFRPVDAAPLARLQSEFGLVWNLVGPEGVSYTTGCRIVQVD